MVDESVMMAIYAPDGTSGDWEKKERKESPDIDRKYADIFEGAGLFPKSNDSGQFVMLSTSTNQGFIDFAIAEKLDKWVGKHKQDNQPIFVLADQFGTKKQIGSGPFIGRNTFIPGFSTKIPKFNNISVKRVSSQGNRIPLRDASIDLITDRLGIIWYTIWDSGPNEREAAVKKLLDEYARVLKKGGKIVIDASISETPAAGTSTLNYLNGIYDQTTPDSILNPVNLEKLGWKVEAFGEGAARIAVLTQINTRS